MCVAASHSSEAKVSRVAPEDAPAVPPGIWRIHGRDYDLTSFVDKHPGGAFLILLGKGTDCTVLFETYHIFNEPRKRLRTHDVTPDGQQPEVPKGHEVSPFMADVRTMVKEHFAGKPKGSQKATRIQLVLMALLLIVEVALVYWWIVGYSALAGILCGFVGYLLMVNLGHDSSHGALTRFPMVNTLCHFIGNSPWVAGHASWSIQHVVSHHQHTNELGQDVDAHHFPFARWHRGTEAEINGGALCGGCHNLFWHMITWLASTLSMSIIHPLHFIVQPLVSQWLTGKLPAGFDGGLETAEIPRHGIHSCPVPKFDSAFEKVAGTFAREKVLLHNTGWVVGNFLVISLSMVLAVAPTIYRCNGGGPDRSGYSPAEIVLSWLWTIGLGLMPFASSSICFMVVTQISHIQEGCQKDSTLYEPDPYKRQALTALDHTASSELGRFLTGGLNLQSVHHCLPSISLCHYRDLYPKFYEVCVKHECAPKNAGGMVNAVLWHLDYVYKLGQGIDAPQSPAKHKATSTSPSKAPKAKPQEKGRLLAELPTASDAPADVLQAAGCTDVVEVPCETVAAPKLQALATSTADVATPSASDSAATAADTPPPAAPKDDAA